MKTEIFKKISKIISINLKILALLIIIFEVFLDIILEKIILDT